MLPDADDGHVESGRRQAGHFGELVGRLEGVEALTPYLAPARYMNYLESDAPEAAAVAYGPNEVRSWDLVCVSTRGGSQFPSVLLHPPPLALRSSRALARCLAVAA